MNVVVIWVTVLSMIKLPKKRYLLGGGAVVTLLALGGAVVAQGAGQTFMPAEVNLADTDYSNSAPQASALFLDSSAYVGASNDSSIVAFTALGKGLSIKEALGTEVRNTDFMATDTCASSGITDSVSVSGNGKTVVIRSSDPLFSCLAGLTAPTDLDVRNRVWAFRLQGNDWSPQLVATVDDGSKANAKPDVDHSGIQVAFSTDQKLVGGTNGEVNVYVKDLNSGGLQKLNDNSQTGSIAPILSDDRIIMSSSGRYVGWGVTPAAYTSRMLSDEAGNGLSDVIVADRDDDDDGRFTNIRMRALAAPKPSEGVSQRSGELMGFAETTNGDKVIYNASIRVTSIQVNTRGYIYDFNSSKLYTIDDKVQPLQSVSADGRYAFQRDVRTMSPYGLTKVASHYDLGEVPGQSTITRTSLAIPEDHVESSYVFTAEPVVLGDRIFVPHHVNAPDKRGKTWEVPVR